MSSSLTPIPMQQRHWPVDQHSPLHHHLYATISHEIIKKINCESDTLVRYHRTRLIIIVVGDCQTNILVIWKTLDHLIIYCHSPPPLTLVINFSSPLKSQWTEKCKMNLHIFIPLDLLSQLVQLSHAVGGIPQFSS